MTTATIKTDVAKVAKSAMVSIRHSAPKPPRFTPQAAFSFPGAIVDIQATNSALLKALQTVINLPPHIVSIKLEMGVDEIPALTIKHHVELDVTHIGSRAREFKIGDTTVTQRYELRAIEP
jgi:hypothetical protein